MAEFTTIDELREKGVLVLLRNAGYVPGSPDRHGDTTYTKKNRIAVSVDPDPRFLLISFLSHNGMRDLCYHASIDQKKFQVYEIIPDSGKSFANADDFLYELFVAFTTGKHAAMIECHIRSAKLEIGRLQRHRLDLKKAIKEVESLVRRPFPFQDTPARKVPRKAKK
jgi:hypothetical protein